MRWFPDKCTYYSWCDICTKYFSSTWFGVYLIALWRDFVLACNVEIVKIIIESKKGKKKLFLMKIQAE